MTRVPTKSQMRVVILSKMAREAEYGGPVQEACMNRLWDELAGNCDGDEYEAAERWAHTATVDEQIDMIVEWFR